jgi:glucose-6-phosphate isomerase
MINIGVSLENIYDFTAREKVISLQQEIDLQYKVLYNKSGRGNEFLGWVNLPSTINPAILSQIEEHARRIQKLAEVYVVIGIGGSYLGARAVIEALNHQFDNLLEKRKYPLILYAGHQMSGDYMAELLDVLDNKDYALAVISKSGTTTEPAIAFRILKNHLEKKYGRAGARDRIIAITDKQKGALKRLADKEGYPTFEVPDDVGGRYSVLTPVGLLPISVAGFSIRSLIAGAARMEEFVRTTSSINENPASAYAAARNALYRSGKVTEILVNYQPHLVYMTEWWKQLFGESEGKEGKGLFPAGVSFTTDLHSMGQYIQEGNHNFFETVLSVENARRNVIIPPSDDDSDGLNYIASKPIQFVNRTAETGVVLAHVDGGVPNIRITLPKVTEDILGELIYFFEIACGVSGYLLGINPFDQPGVEAYKKNMFALLGKPGFEKETAAIRKRIK